MQAPKATALELAYTIPLEHIPPRKVNKTASNRWSRVLTSLSANSFGSLTNSTQTVVKTTAVPNWLFRRCEGGVESSAIESSTPQKGCSGDGGEPRMAHLGDDTLQSEQASSQISFLLVAPREST